LNKKQWTIHNQQYLFEISSGDLDEFLSNFQSNRPLVLLDNIKKTWNQFLLDPNKKPGYVTNNKSLKIHDKNPKGKMSGIYAIYAKMDSEKHPICFYVGISTSCIRGRFRTHLKMGGSEKYSKAFAKLDDYDELFLCYGIIQKEETKGRFKEKLELLECCLTTSLRPRFLVLVAEADRD
jgi:hypothetical protein